MRCTRRTFINSAGLSGILGIGNILTSCSDIGNSEGLLIGKEDGEIVYIGKQRKAKITFKISAKSHPKAPFSLLHEIIPPGDYIPEHKHLNEDEFIFISHGEAEVQCGEEVEMLSSGGVAYIPKTTWHGLKNNGYDYVHMFFGYSPAGFEDYFRSIGVKSIKDSLRISKEDWERTSKRFGVIYR